MLGKLFSQAQALAGAMSGGSSPGNKAQTDAGDTWGHVAGVTDDDIAAGFLPESVLEEADTRALLYGPAAIKSRACSVAHGGSFGDGVRVAVVLELPCADKTVFDSDTSLTARRQRRMSTASTGDAAREPTHHRGEAPSALSRLTRSLSSAHLSTNTGGSTKAHGNVPRSSHRRTTTLAPSFSGGSGKSDSTLSGRSSPALSSRDSTPPPATTTTTTTSLAPVVHPLESEDPRPLPVRTSELKEIVFGSTPVMFSGTVSKLHPLPDRVSGGSSGSSAGGAWLASKMFKVRVGDVSPRRGIETVVIDRTRASGSTVTRRRAGIGAPPPVTTTHPPGSPNGSSLRQMYWAKRMSPRTTPSGSSEDLSAIARTATASSSGSTASRPGLVRRSTDSSVTISSRDRGCLSSNGTAPARQSPTPEESSTGSPAGSTSDSPVNSAGSSPAEPATEPATKPATTTKLRWSPKPTVPNPTGATMAAGSSLREIRVGMCVFFDGYGPDALVNHWEEVSFALADLQQVVFARLEALLGPALQRRAAAQRLCGGGGPLPFTFSLNDDDEVAQAVDYFKHRFAGVLRIPRVLCGQDRYPELLRELAWGAMRWEFPPDCEGFLGAVIASFIKFNAASMLAPDASWTNGNMGTTVSRTVVVSFSRIVARRLLFMLTSLIRTENSRKMRAQLEQLRRLATDQSGSLLPATTTTATGVDIKKRHAATAADPETPGSDTCSGCSPTRFPTRISNTDGGWEIPRTETSVGSDAAIAVPHVVRPMFSSPALSYKDRSRHPSSDGLRRSFATSASSSGAASSLLSHFWQSDSSPVATPISSVDEYFPAAHNFDDDLSTSVNSNGTPHWQPLERSATMLFPNGVPHDPLDGSCPPTKGTETPTTLPPVFHTVNAAKPNEASMLDVEPLNSSMLADDSMPLVLPPVAGHIPEFHPDFAIQACPLSSDLDERITRAMLRDAEVVPVAADAHLGTTVMSQALVVNIRKREIFEWRLKRVVSATGEPRQELTRRAIFANRTPAPDYAEVCTLVSRELRRIISNEGKGTALWELRAAVQNLFGTL